MSFREQIQTFIDDQKITPSRLAKDAGLAIPVVTRFLKGERGLSVSSLEKILPVIQKQERKNEVCS